MLGTLEVPSANHFSLSLSLSLRRRRKAKAVEVDQQLNMSALYLSSLQPLSIRNKQFLSPKSPTHENRLLHLTQHSTFVSYNPLRLSSNCKEMMMKKNKKMPSGLGIVCYSSPLTPSNLQWISTISTAVLLLVKGTAMNKSFLVPLFALQAPSSIISWIKGENGMWMAFLALLIRLFFPIPGELELPFAALLLVIVSPYQVMNLCGTQRGVILSLLIAGYVAFQHFSRAGSLKNAFDQGSIVATVAIICVFAVPCVLLI